MSFSLMCMSLHYGRITEYLSKKAKHAKSTGKGSKPCNLSCVIVMYRLFVLFLSFQDGGGGGGYSKTVYPKTIIKESNQGTWYHIQPDDFMLSKTPGRASPPTGRSVCVCFQFLLCQTGWWCMYPLGLEELKWGWTIETKLPIRLAREIMRGDSIGNITNAFLLEPILRHSGKMTCPE